jgi:hypothetical protein
MEGKIVKSSVNYGICLPFYESMFWIRGILVQILIHGSGSVTNGSGSVTFKMQTKNYFFVYYFLKVHFYHSSEIKGHKEVTKQ